jgi:hypothetical protein
METRSTKRIRLTEVPSLDTLEDAKNKFQEGDNAYKHYALDVVCFPDIRPSVAAYVHLSELKVGDYFNSFHTNNIMIYAYVVRKTKTSIFYARLLFNESNSISDTYYEDDMYRSWHFFDITKIENIDLTDVVEYPFIESRVCYKAKGNFIAMDEFESTDVVLM